MTPHAYSNYTRSHSKFPVTALAQVALSYTKFPVNTYAAPSTQVITFRLRSQQMGLERNSRATGVSAGSKDAFLTLNVGLLLLLLSG